VSAPAGENTRTDNARTKRTGLRESLRGTRAEARTATIYLTLTTEEIQATPVGGGRPDGIRDVLAWEAVAALYVLVVVGPFAHPGTVDLHDLALMVVLGFGQMGLGLAFLSKYAAVYGLIGIALHLILSEDARRAWSPNRILLALEAIDTTRAHGEAVRPEAVRYINRLSDLLFVLARVLARASGHGEVLWNHERRKA